MNDEARRREDLETLRRKFGIQVQLFERDFGMSSYLHRAPKLKHAHQLEGAEILIDRETLIDRLPKAGDVIEVGVDRGNFSRRILETAKPRSLTLIDIDLSRITDENRSFVLSQRNVTILEGDSSSTLSTLTGEYDWIYIDADHGYQAVQKDIVAATRKVKLGGFLVFNDYTMWSPANMMNYGVLKAVHELLNKDQNWAMRYLALQGAGYHDVALKRLK